MSITVIKKFPDFSSRNFNLKNYYSTYISSNVVVNASTNYIHYSDHAAPLSIKYVIKGSEYYTANNCKYRVTPDNFLVLNQWQNYESCIDSDETVESLAVFFRPEYVSKILYCLTNRNEFLLGNPGVNLREKQVLFFERLYPKDKIIIPLLLNIHKMLGDKRNEHALSEQMYFLLEGLMTTHRGALKDIDKLSMVKSSTRSEIYRRLNIAKDYIDSCYGENVSLSALAKASCMNKYHLLRTFKNFYGLTPHQYLKQVRLNEAKKLLEKTTKSVSEISSLVGFEFLSSFSQLFYSKFKLSPKAYRNFRTS